MKVSSLEAGDVLFEQASLGTHFYIVKEGTLSFFIAEQLVKKFVRGDSFGELALLQSCPRSGTVVAETKCSVFCLDRKDFKDIIDTINNLEFSENKVFLNSIPLLNNLDEDQKTILCSNLIKESYEEGEEIVKEGDPSHCFYIIKEGEFIAKINNFTRIMRKGDSFGLTSLITQSNRTSTVSANTKCICFSISVDTLKLIIGENFIETLLLNFVKMGFQKSKVFNTFNTNLIDKTIHNFKLLKFEKNKIVFPIDYDTSKNVAVLIEGNLVDENSRRVFANRGNLLFEEDLMAYDPKDLNKSLNHQLKFNIVADPDCILYMAETDRFVESLGGPLKEKMHNSIILSSLLSVPILHNLPRSKLEYLTEKIKYEKIKNKTKIITQGEKSNQFYIIKSGKVDILSNNLYIRTLTSHEYFGERALFYEEPRSATAVANGEVEIFSLDFETFQKIIDENLKVYLKTSLALHDNGVELADLDHLADLGIGNYGNVYLVRNRKNKFEYALKTILKDQIDEDSMHENLDQEKKILLQINHPFIVKLVKTLKDSRNIFFLMEYVKGKELFDIIRTIGLLDKYQTQFYSSSMLIAMDYLHNQKIIYRDIKPENIMVTENGYIKIIDFGTAKLITGRTSTIIGTPHYMAPEVILGDGYTFCIDIWSIAVCIYEFACGGLPFGDDENEPMNVYLSIINNELKFPKIVKDKQFQQLLVQMLSKNPLSRLYKFNQVKLHPYFRDFDWEGLVSMSLKPPYQSNLPSKNDKHPSNFVEFIQTHLKDSPVHSKFDAKTKEINDEWFKNF